MRVQACAQGNSGLEALIPTASGGRPRQVPLALPNSGLPRFSEPVDVLRYHRLVDLAIRGMAPPLERLQDALGLSTAELGEVFGVSRQAELRGKVERAFDWSTAA